MLEQNLNLSFATKCSGSNCFPMNPVILSSASTLMFFGVDNCFAVALMSLYVAVVWLALKTYAIFSFAKNELQQNTEIQASSLQ